MRFTVKKNNNWTKKPVNYFLQDGAVSAREWTLFLELKVEVHT